HHAAAVEDRHPLAALRLFHVVRRQHDGDAVRVAQRAQLRQEVAPGGGIEPRARLVEEQDGGPGEETLGELDAAAESARQPIDELPPALGDPEAVQEGVDARGELGTAQAVEPTVMAEVLLDGELAVDARVLEDDAQPAAHGVRRAPHVVAEDARDASVRGQEGCEDPEERALAAAVRPEEAEQLATRDGERRPGERLAGAEAAAQVYHLDRRRAAGRDFDRRGPRGPRMLRQRGGLVRRSGRVTRWSTASHRLRE